MTTAAEVEYEYALRSTCPCAGCGGGTCTWNVVGTLAEAERALAQRVHFHGAPHMSIVRRRKASEWSALPPAPGRTDVENCTCYFDCMENPATGCSLTGDWHVHAGERYPLHPDAPGDH